MLGLSTGRDICMEDPEYSADLLHGGAMDVPVTASLGSMGPLLRQLQYSRPRGVSAAKIRLLKDGLGALCISLKNLSELKAEDEEDASSFTAKWWMKLVRELCYDTEDYLDEHSGAGDAGACPRSGRRLGGFRVCRQKLQWRPTQIGEKDQGRCGGAFIRLLNNTSTNRTNLKQRSQIAITFSELMARVEDASERQRELFIQLAPRKTIEPADHDLGVSSQVSDHDSVHMKINTADGGQNSLVLGFEEPTMLLGFEEPTMNSLVDLLAFEDEEEKQLKVVPIFGPAGAGKSTLARTLYDKYGGKFQCRAFVRMRNPDMRKLLIGVLSQIKAPPDYAAFSDVHHLIDNIIKHLQGKRFFVIIDDLWSTSAWDVISRAFPHGVCFSRIITTTQFEDVALACCGYQSEYVFKMRPLNDGQSRKLFFSVIFRSGGVCPPDSQEVSYGIIRKCGGLPLAIVYIASLLAREPKLEKWVHIQNSLPSTSEGLKEAVSFIYNKFPSRLKTCLLYFSMYPEGSVIKKDELVKQWVAEGFLGAVDGQDTVEIAGGYFDELVIRGMIQAVDTNHNGKVLTCTVHQIVLNFIRYKSMEENLVITVNYFQSAIVLPVKVRRLSVQFGGAKSAMIPENIRMPQVRSLLFCGFFKCVPPILDYRLLRVLILHIWADQDETSFDLTGICQLFRLRHLTIECDIITVDLPDEIRGLQYLETLQVDAKLSAVPYDIVHLNKLLHLRLPSESILPHGVGHMTSLRTLGYFDLGSNSEDNVMDLCKLTNLQDLHLTCSTVQSAENLEKNMQLFGSILEKLGNLQSLTLLPTAGTSSMSISCDGLISVFPAPTRLHRLDLLPRICIFASLPGRIGELSRLSILKIAVRELSMDDIGILQGLPALAALSLSAREVQWLVFDNRGFRVLKYFKFMYAAPCLSFLGGAMPSVQKLRIGFNANRLKKHSWKIFGFQQLTSLREISIKLGGIGAQESDKRRAFLSGLMAAVDNQNTHTVNIKFVEHELFHDKYYGTQDAVPDLSPQKDEFSGEDENIRAGILRITAPSESFSRLSLSGKIRARDLMLDITGAYDLQSLDQVFEFYDPTKVEELTLTECPPLEFKHLRMLTSLKKLVFQSTDHLFVPIRGHGDVEFQFPVEHLVVKELHGASGKELTELLTHLPSLFKLEIRNCKTIRQMVVGVDLQQATSAAASDSEVEHEKEDDGLLLFPSHLSDSLRELIIWDCPELVLVEETRRDSKTETRRGGVQALWSLEEFEIRFSPMFLSACLSSSPSLHLFPSSLQSLRIWAVEGMGTLEPLSNLTSLTSLELWFCGEDLRCEGLGPLLTAGGQLSNLTVTGSPRFFAGWDPNPRRVLQDEEGEKKQQLQLVPPSSSSKLQEIKTNGAAGFLAAPVCSFVSSSLTKLLLFGTKEMECFSNEQEDALLLLASLQELQFCGFDKLQHLPAGLHKLTNLKNLEIDSCPAVRSLPKDGLPKSLQELNVHYCGNQELKKQCKGLSETNPNIRVRHY
ncbi:putative disease resistance protein RGA3 [Brachypodium distachyon]|uniref:Uncharacterized protein n=1 Tax=Brachypodium distachyon TaxID=15368 RepID=A0A0Q3KJ59_BRADI|nr:putative disease resistance protein RGA3 [Brachypodium distachyon]KQK24228.1 hypothetical protein BRADI_1g78926v3 [Brachypodium distachyon]|eukprot:XP_024312691.1 putative disease resistance protein RGA3 [Brachypodium distachyon]